MKGVFIYALAQIGDAKDTPTSRYDVNVRRYSQLADMMNFFNQGFDEKKYWAYGCNCLIIGMSISYSFRVVG